MQEITGAKPVRDANFRRVVHGEQQTHLTQNQAALDVQVVSRRPISSPSKHFQRCIRSVSESARCNSGWGLQFKWPPATVAARKHRSRASAQVGFISPLCPGQHWRLRPAFALRATARQAISILPPRSSLRISFVKKSCRGSTGWRLHEFSSRSPTAETRRRERRQCRCKPCREHQSGLQALK